MSAACAVALLAPSAASATYGGANGELAVTATQVDRASYEARIELVEPGGATAGRFARCTDDTTTGADDPVAGPSEPEFSPDGRRLAYVRRTDDLGNGDFFLSVFTSRADGTGERPLRRGRELPVGSTFANYVDVAWRPLP